MNTHVQEKGSPDTPTIFIKMDVEQMIFRTDSSGIYEYIESCLNEESTIDNLAEVQSVCMEAEGVDGGEVLIRVWITEYTTN